MPRCTVITNTWSALLQCPVSSTLSRRLPPTTHHFAALSPPEALLRVDEECNDFLPWLERKAGREISSVLAIGKSSFGRSLYASDYIRGGDCILKVPYNVQMAPDNLPPEISCLLGDEVGNVAKVALLILLEQKLGQSSEWAPYVSRFPKAEDMHNTIFWSNDELAMIRSSALYRETLKQKAQIERDFISIKRALDGFHDGFSDVTLQEFQYAYGLVTSRAWESSRGVSMIPFADFLNHDGNSEAYVLCDDLRQNSEVLADRDCTPGDQILIRYGKFSNATLLLDFGFTVSHNIFDQVLVELSMPYDDQFCTWKLELLERYHVRNGKDINDFTSDGNTFRIKEVHAASKKGKGIPQALRAFARIMSSNSQQEISALVKEAAEIDGRLARYPLKNRIKEIEAHELLLSKLAQLVQEYKAYIKLSEPTSPYLQEKSVRRKKLAQDLLTGELRVLKSAIAWLKNYCLTLSDQ